MTATVPSVSIIMTTFNAEAFVRASISAALSQTFDDYEIVIVDDGSTDSTVDICRSFVDSRLLLIEEERLGRSRALNRAISAARGRYIAINDADDLSFPTRLETTMRFLETHPDIAIFYTPYTSTPVFLEHIPENVLVAAGEVAAKPFWYDSTDLYRNNPINHSTVIFPKSVWSAVGGYDERIPICVDYDFYMRAIGYGKVAMLSQSTVLSYSDPRSFFKKKSAITYLTTLRIIRNRARSQLSLPTWVRIYDWMPYYLAVSSAVRLSWRRLRNS
jgi:glycosyltransferase involved in cell wall biosynthesis